MKRVAQTLAALARGLITLLAASLAAASAAAHLMPNSAVNLDFSSQAVSAEILIPLNELSYATRRPFKLHAGPVPAADEAYLRTYLQDRIAIQSPDHQPWGVRLKTLSVVSDAWGTDLRIEAGLTPPAGASPRKFDLDYRAVIDQVNNHFVLVFAHSDFRTGTFSSEPQMIGGLQAPTFVLHVDRGPGSAWRGFASALALGMRHIAEGHDHLLFLIALILPAPLVAAGRRWGGFGGVRHTAKGLFTVVSAFTVGHSITLIGGAFFNWKLPSQPVEIGIAISIFISSIHAWRPIFNGREALIAGGFGLVHGLSFASVIANFGLEPLQKAQSILGFNLGIEFIQLTVVLMVLPSLVILARLPSYVWLRTGGALLAAVASLAWIAERATGQLNPIAEGIDAALGRAPWLFAALCVAALVAVLRFWLARRSGPVATAPA
jgi:HupE / UreJ protein